MKHKQLLLPLAFLALVCLSSGAFALSECPKEVNYIYNPSAETFLTQNSENSLTLRLLAGGGCGMNEGDSITVNAVYNIKTASNTGEEKKTPLLKITMTKHNKDALYATQGWSTQNDTWDFKFDALNAKGETVKSVQKTIWETSSTAISAGRTKQDISGTDSQVLFSLDLRLDEDSYWPQGGQVNQINIEAKFDILKLMKILANDNSETCIGTGCGFSLKDSNPSDKFECPKDLKYMFQNGQFEGAYSPFNANIINYETGCFLSKGQTMTVNASFLEMSASGTPTKKKTSLLKITLSDYHLDKLPFGSDNDSWDFKFDLLKSDGTVLKSDSKEIWEYSDIALAAEGDKTKLDISLPSGERAFHVAFNMDSDAGWTGQLDKIYIEAKPNVADLIKKLAEGASANPCNNNGKCEAGETVANCPNDCKVVTPAENILGGLINLNKRLVSDLGLK